MQGTLFEPIQKRIEEEEIPVERVKVDPFGTPDKKGRYLYERWGERFDKLKPSSRVFIKKYLLTNEPDRAEIFMLLQQYHKADIRDRDDIEFSLRG